jgi:arabinogalactan oligomer / maltooligosaccharide transport system permease protein
VGLLRNTFLTAGGAAVLAVVLGLTAAYAFARFRSAGRRTGLFALLVGAFLPAMALTTPLYILLSALHSCTLL